MADEVLTINEVAVPPKLAEKTGYAVLKERRAALLAAAVTGQLDVGPAA